MSDSKLIKGIEIKSKEVLDVFTFAIQD